MNLIVIPARYGSRRFPGKPLSLILGKPLVWWVWHKATQSTLRDKIIVATDDKRIKKTVEDFGGEAFMTSKEHPSGTDRVAEVVRKIEANFVVNLQGDSPLVRPEWIDMVFEALKEDPGSIVTIATRSNDPEEFFSRDIVKVVVGKNGRALYFSRSPIPGSHPGRREEVSFLKHIGVYGFERNVLLKYVDLPRGELEEREGLEQLRALEWGIPIRVLIVEGDEYPVDRPEDIKRVEELLKSERGST
jgi:3-deoxy-manno-octulosonate cytidylyltransferase (CMP-KDO synthetase)